MQKYLVFIIQGYAQRMDDGSLTDTCELQLIDTTVDGAMKRAEEIIKKPFYRLSMVVEKYVEQK